jgi:methylmalonyl-CoA/ethylmalonyl-CoA epimerase
MDAEELRALNKNRCISQICYVTDDYQRTIKFFTEKLLIGPWSVLVNSEESAYNVRDHGEPAGKWAFYIAAAMVGDIEIEVIQPIEGPNPYNKFLAEKGPGLHHVKERITDNDKLLERVRHFEGLGSPVNYQGMYMEDHYYYLDTYDELGAYYEMGNSAKVSKHPGLVGQYPEK